HPAQSSPQTAIMGTSPSMGVPLWRVPGAQPKGGMEAMRRQVPTASIIPQVWPAHKRQDEV
ncbi:MAG: hypothetical protein QME94_19715, partial [Anaerolineae bacterium]|nr:hypothetical protein [Anaerolineae bacterium]